MRTRYLFFITLSMLLLILAACSAEQSTYKKGVVKTWNSYRWRNIVRQNYDYSCGAAAFATLLNAYFGLNVNEETIVLLMVQSLTKKEMQERTENGFSMHDLQRVAKTMGLLASGVELPDNAVSRLKGPVLVILRTKDYEHFVILKSADAEFAYLADSARGNIRLPLYDFYNQWDGVALVIGMPDFGLPQIHGLSLNSNDTGYNTKDIVRQMSPGL